MKYTSRFSVLVTVISFVLLGVGCGSSAPVVPPTRVPIAPAPAPVAQVTATIQNFAFSPSDLNIAVGTTVTWINDDAMPHTVTADDGSFQSATLSTGGTFSHIFTKAGTVSYHCNFHPSMKANVTVK